MLYEVITLRISVTDRCNLRCTYCMPADGVKLMKHDDLLSFEEIESFTQLAVAKGRITSYNVCYTKLLRKGLNIGGHEEPLFVTGTDVKRNIIYVGEGTEHPGLYRAGLFISKEEGIYILFDQEHVITSYSIHYTKLYDLIYQQT